MITADTSTFTLGEYVVHQRPRFDNPAFAVYIILLAGKLIGKQFSRPTETDCRWLLLQDKEQIVYAGRPSIGTRYSEPRRAMTVVKSRFATAKNKR